MTFADDFSTQTDSGFDENADYPTAFGIKFTPQISGIACGVLGVFGAGYILMTMVMPAWSSYQEVSTQQQEKETQLTQLKSGDIDRLIGDLNVQLAQKKDLKAQILTLFADEKNLDTLLLDINNVVTTSGAKLNTYTPEATTVTVEDGSLGKAVDKKLKRKSINLEIEGTHSQLQATLRSIEKLQPLLALQNYSSNIEAKQKLTFINKGGQSEVVPVSEPKLKSSFRLDAIVPLSEEELAKLQPAPAPAPAANGTTPAPSK